MALGDVADGGMLLGHVGDQQVLLARRGAEVFAVGAHGQTFDAVPFFWSQHYDVPINYLGHAESWDEIAIDGDIAGCDCLLRYKLQGRTLAVASIYRDVASLQEEAAMERAQSRL